jgi:hypothetical protein
VFTTTYVVVSRFISFYENHNSTPRKRYRNKKEKKKEKTKNEKKKTDLLI